MANINGIDPPVLNDQDYVDKIIDSFTAVDNHDHSTGKGLQIPTGGIEDGAITNAKVGSSAGIVYSKLSLTGSIVNADIGVSAAIAYSKLNLSGSIVNADVNSSAAIAYSKLNLSGSIVNADVNSSAAIAYSKLNLATSIVNGDISNSAAIARSKLADGTADHVVINSVTGALVSEAQLAISRGGTGAATANAGFNALSPMTTKGDIISFSTVAARLAVGTDGQVLTADSAQTLGVKWSTPASAPDAVYDLNNFALAVSFNAGAMTVAVKTKAGSDPSAGDPVKVSFLTSETSGIYVQRSITAALSLVVPSGAQLGGSNGVAQSIYFYLMDNSGTVELAVAGYRVNDDWTKISTTAIGTGSDDGGTLYSTSARSNLMSRCVGYMTSTQTTSGTWAQSPSLLLAGPVRASLHETLASVSSQKTVGGSDRYLQMTSNSVVLTPGIWEIDGSIIYANNGSSPNFTQIFGNWCTANGADTNSQPTAFSPMTSMFAVGWGEQRFSIASSSVVTSGSALVSPTTVQSLFVVPYILATNATNARVTSYSHAKRLR